MFWQNFFLSFSDYEGYFLELPLKYLMHDCQNYKLRVQRSTLRRVPDYEGKFSNFHWNILGMVVKTTVYVFKGAPWESLSFLRFFSKLFSDFERWSTRLLAKIFNSVAKTALLVSKELLDFRCSSLSCFFLTSGSREKNLSFEKKVSSVLSNLHSILPRTFWGIPFTKTIFFQFSLHFQPKLFELWRNFSSESSKCILRVQRNTFTKTICWLCETISDFGQGNVGVAAETLQPC